MAQPRLAGGRWLLASLAALAVALFAYRQWSAVYVPPGVLPEDRTPAKLLHLAFAVIQNMEVIVPALGLPRSFGRAVQNTLVNLLQTGWVFGTLSDDDVVVSYEMFDGVRVRIYRKRNSASAETAKQALVYIHGGGFVWFNTDWADPIVRELVRRLDIVAFSPEYRLAPEHPFPAAFNDCLATANYVLRQHSRLNVDPNRVMVAGDSAGGNLAAAVAAELKKQLRLQILIYPILQAFDFYTPSYVDNDQAFVIGRDAPVIVSLLYGNRSLAYIPTYKSNRHLDRSIRSRYERHVHSDFIPAHLNVTNRRTAPIGDDADGAVSAAVHDIVLNPRFMPLMADNLDDYADAYIITAQYDVLRDDGLIYAQRLTQARNVKVELHHYKHGYHAFLNFVDGPCAMTVARNAMEDLVNFLEKL